jgi:TatA/E family protein of Tat protein translocase
MDVAGRAVDALLRVDSGSIMSSMNLGFSEMVFLFLLALIIFGPKKMPEIGRQIGKALNDFKRASNEFKAQIESEIANIERETTPQILPPSEPPRSTVASGTLVDVPAVEHVPAQLTPPSDSSHKAPDA